MTIRIKPLQFSPYSVIATTVLTIAVLYASTVRLSGIDFWLQAKIGELIYINHSIPDTLLFPFTEIASDHFNAHEWLTSLFFYLSLSQLGEDAMPYLIGMLGLILFISATCLAYARSMGNYPLSLFCGLVAMFAENYRHVLRPELPTLILFTWLLYLLQSFNNRPSGRHHAICFAIIVLWANSHGSFILGPIMVSLFAIGKYLDFKFGRRELENTASVRQLLLLLFTALFSCVINPYGMDLIYFALSFGTNADATRSLTEWMPTFSPIMLHVTGFWIALIVSFSTLGFMVYGRSRIGFIEIFLFLAFTALAVRAIRFPVYLGIISAFIIPVCVSASWRGKTVERNIYLLCIALGLITLGLVNRYGNASKNGLYNSLDRYKFTIPMVQAIKNPGIHGNVLNTMELGAELVYLAYPRLKPAIDCRVDSYGVEYNSFISTLFTNKNLFDEFVKRYDVHYILMDTGIFEKFSMANPDAVYEWTIYFSDHRAVMLRRKNIVN